MGVWADSVVTHTPAMPETPEAAMAVVTDQTADGTAKAAERTPIEAGLGWACALDKEFTGVEVLRKQKEEGPRERLVAFVMEEPGIPRHGMPIVEGGEVTSGTMSPTLGHAIGLGYVGAEQSEPSTRITVDVRGRPRSARIVKKPFYKREEQ